MTIAKVGQLSDVAEGTIVPVEVDGQQLILARVNGAIHALARKCPHMGADLSGGTIVGNALVCPKHKAAFEVATGESVSPAKIAFLKMKTKPLASYPVTIEGDDVLVAVG